MKFTTSEANGIYIALLDYFIMCDDPKYSTLHKFRAKILKVANNEDRATLVQHFESETQQPINYFTSPY